MTSSQDYPPVLYVALEDLARTRDVASYKEIASRCGLENQDRYYSGLSKMLDAINDDELAKLTPPLSAVVINKQRGRPGSKFFEGMEERGIFPGGDEETWWQQVRDSLQDYWIRHWSSDKSRISR